MYKNTKSLGRAIPAHPGDNFSIQHDRSFLVEMRGPTSFCCAKSCCIARYPRNALGLKTPHRGLFFTASFFGSILQKILKIIIHA